MRRINLADASHEFSNADLKFKFATYLMIHRDGRSFEDIFEMRRDRDAFAVAESYTATLDQAGVYYAVSCFEIDRLAIVRREERAQDVLFYR